MAGSGGGLAWSTPRCCLAPRWGPPLGGLLLALDGWQGVFLVNLPLLVVPLVVSWRWIPARRRASSSAGFDLSGAALLCASLVALAWLLNGQGLSQPARLGRVRRRRCCVRCGFHVAGAATPGPGARSAPVPPRAPEHRERRGGAEQSGGVGDAARASGPVLAAGGAGAVPASRSQLRPPRFRLGPSHSRRSAGACRTGWVTGSPPP